MRESRRHITLHALIPIVALCLALPASGADTAAAAPAKHDTTETEMTDRTGHVHDFDFLIGSWRVANRRLKKRWAGSDDWDEFPAQVRVEQWLGGGVNVDQIDFPTRGFSGLTLRTFDHERRQWSIYWINSTRGVLDTPVVGGFAGTDRGEFYGDDTDDGCAIKVRFIWTRLAPDRARWEQAFSLDGHEWETNWVMELSRA